MSTQAAIPYPLNGPEGGERTRVAVLGASGQVGLALVRRLSQRSRLAVAGLCRSPLSATRVAHAGAEVIVPAAGDPAEFGRALSAFDVVVNCALPSQGPTRNARENEALAEALCSVGERTAVVHLSSVAVYGNAFLTGRTRFSEPCPEDRYGREKLAMERRLRRLARQRGVRLWICRLGHVWGPELNWSRILLRLVGDPDFRLPFDGAKPSNAIYIDNLAVAVAHLAAHRPLAQTWNLVDFPQRTWRELTDLHAQATGRPSVAAMPPAESAAAYGRLGEGRGRGLASSVVLDLAGWARRLPASFVASSPALQAAAESLLARLKSDELESRLKALYWQAVARQRAHGPAPAGPLAAMLSDTVPGRILEYSGAAYAVDLPSLAAFAESISQPPAGWPPCQK